MPARRLASPSRPARLGAALALCLSLGACDQSGAPADDGAPAEDTAAEPAVAPVPENPAAQVSYSAGYQIAEQFAGQIGEDFDAEAFSEGVDDAVGGVERRVDQATFASARTELLERRRARLEQRASANLAAAEAFLAENAERAEVTSTDSGLQYEVLSEGEGASPESASTRVSTHYTGRLLDGTVFDSSEARGEPAVFGLDEVIPGWTEALLLMQVGDRWRLWLPPELAYGSRPPSPDIPPNALLEFEVELLGLDPEEG